MQSSNEFVIVTQIVHTKHFITLTIADASWKITTRRDKRRWEFLNDVRTWQLKAPYSVGTLASLALLSNVCAGVITTFDECVEFMESFAKLSVRDRIGYVRIIASPRVLANSKFKVWFTARNHAISGSGFDLRKRAYLMSNAPIPRLDGNFEEESGDAEIGQLVQGACYVPSY